MRRAAALVLAAALGCAPRMAPGPVPHANRPDWKPLRQFLDSAVAAGAAPGIVVAVSWPGHRYVYGTGRLGEGIRTRPNHRTVYDLASLTKVVVLTTVTMMAVDQGRLGLDDPVQDPASWPLPAPPRSRC